MKTVTTFALLFIFLIPTGWGNLAYASDAKPGNSKPQADLFLAVLQGNLDAVKRQIHTGVDLNRKDAYGSTPLMIAATFGRTGIAEALINAGAELNQKNPQGSTALHIAAFLCHDEIVQALLNKGANRYLRNNLGNTPWESVAGPFNSVKSAYDKIAAGLAPLGLKLDYNRIKTSRPRIAMLLQPGKQELAAVDYAPLKQDDWPVSTPAEQELDPLLVAQPYLEATGLSNIYGLLVIKNGYVVAEKYFNRADVSQRFNRQSITKSVTSALTGIALQQGCLASPDQKMLDFFPTLADQITDPRKKQITIRQLLQMRSGYPWEERTPPYMERLYLSPKKHWLQHLVDFPLTSDPGTQFAYSNLDSHSLGVIVSRACHTDLRTYAQKYLFTPLKAQVGNWYQDSDNYYFGSMGISLRARDMAKLGWLYLHRGQYCGKRILPAAWVKDSLKRYSNHISFSESNSSIAGSYFRDLGYGYQWWSAKVGKHAVHFAWGHGGNLIILLPDLDMVVVSTADPLEQVHWTNSWKYEVGVINLVGKFIQTLQQ